MAKRNVNSGKIDNSTLYSDYDDNDHIIPNECYRCFKKIQHAKHSLGDSLNVTPTSSNSNSSAGSDCRERGNRVCSSFFNLDSFKSSYKEHEQKQKFKGSDDLLSLSGQDTERYLCEDHKNFLKNSAEILKQIKYTRNCRICKLIKDEKITRQQNRDKSHDFIPSGSTNRDKGVGKKSHRYELNRDEFCMDQKNEPENEDGEFCADCDEDDSQPGPVQNQDVQPYDQPVVQNQDGPQNEPTFDSDQPKTEPRQSAKTNRLGRQSKMVDNGKTPEIDECEEQMKKLLMNDCEENNNNSKCNQQNQGFRQKKPSLSGSNSMCKKCLLDCADKCTSPKLDQSEIDPGEKCYHEKRRGRRNSDPLRESSEVYGTDSNESRCVVCGSRMNKNGHKEPRKRFVDQRNGYEENNEPKDSFYSDVQRDEEDSNGSTLKIICVKCTNNIRAQDRSKNNQKISSQESCSPKKQMNNNNNNKNLKGKGSPQKIVCEICFEEIACSKTDKNSSENLSTKEPVLKYSCAICTRETSNESFPENQSRYPESRSKDCETDSKDRVNRSKDFQSLSRHSAKSERKFCDCQSSSKETNRKENVPPISKSRSVSKSYQSSEHQKIIEPAKKPSAVCCCIDTESGMVIQIICPMHRPEMNKSISNQSRPVNEELMNSSSSEGEFGETTEECDDENVNKNLDHHPRASSTEDINETIMKKREIVWGNNIPPEFIIGNTNYAKKHEDCCVGRSSEKAGERYICPNNKINDQIIKLCCGISSTSSYSRENQKVNSNSRIQGVKRNGTPPNSQRSLTSSQERNKDLSRSYEEYDLEDCNNSTKNTQSSNVKRRGPRDPPTRERCNESENNYGRGYKTDSRDRIPDSDTQERQPNRASNVNRGTSKSVCCQTSKVTVCCQTDELPNSKSSNNPKKKSSDSVCFKLPETVVSGPSIDECNENKISDESNTSSTTVCCEISDAKENNKSPGLKSADTLCCLIQKKRSNSKDLNNKPTLNKSKINKSKNREQNKADNKPTSIFQQVRKSIAEYIVCDVQKKDGNRSTQENTEDNDDCCEVCCEDLCDSK